MQKSKIGISTFVEKLNKPHPETMVEAQRSLPFTLAVTLEYSFVDEVSVAKGLNDALTQIK